MNPATNEEEVYFVVNSTELRLHNFQMDALAPRPVAPRRATRHTRLEPERPDTSGRRFRLPASVENQILALCW
jgi:hypothetical protein